MTDIELNFEIQKAEMNHTALKEEISRITYQIEELENSVNNKLKSLEDIEKNYVDLMKEMIDR